MSFTSKYTGFPGPRSETSFGSECALQNCTPGVEVDTDAGLPGPKIENRRGTSWLYLHVWLLRFAGARQEERFHAQQCHAGMRIATTKVAPLIPFVGDAASWSPAPIASPTFFRWSSGTFARARNGGDQFASCTRSSTRDRCAFRYAMSSAREDARNNHHHPPSGAGTNRDITPRCLAIEMPPSACHALEYIWPIE